MFDISNNLNEMSDHTFYVKYEKISLLCRLLICSAVQEFKMYIYMGWTRSQELEVIFYQIINDYTIVKENQKTDTSQLIKQTLGEYFHK